MVDFKSPLASRSRKLDAAANSPEDTDQNGHKANFPSEAEFQWAGRQENISRPVEAEVFS